MQSTYFQVVCVDDTVALDFFQISLHQTSFQNFKYNFVILTELLSKDTQFNRCLYYNYFSLFLIVESVWPRKISGFLFCSSFHFSSVRLLVICLNLIFPIFVLDGF